GASLARPAAATSRPPSVEPLAMLTARRSRYRGRICSPPQLIERGPPPVRIAGNGRDTGKLLPSGHPCLAFPGSSHAYSEQGSGQAMNTAQRAGLSFDSMRNLLLPVTSVARQAARQAGATFSGFQSIGDQVITAHDGVRGVNELFGYDIGGVPEVFDQTVLTDGATTKLYLLLVQ